MLNEAGVFADVRLGLQRVLDRLSEGWSDAQFLSLARPEYIEVDSHVRVEETLAVEGRFTRPLNPDQDHRFHQLGPPLLFS
jgi:hypothetical protein